MLFSCASVAWGQSDERVQRVRARSKLGLPAFMVGDLGVVEPPVDRVFRLGGEAALRSLEADVALVIEAELARSFAATGDERLVGQTTEADAQGNLHLRYTITIGGRPLFGAALIAHVRAATGEVYALNGDFAPAHGHTLRADLAGNAAISSAARALPGEGASVLERPVLGWVLDPVTGEARGVWRARVGYLGRDGQEIDTVFADAATGVLIARWPTIHRAKVWRTHTGSNGTALPGRLLCTNNQPCGDPVAQAAHNNAGTTYDYYQQRYGRDSINNAGLALVSTVHHRVGFNNAFWNGTQMVYGDGDGSLFSPLGSALDVVAHELTHGVTENESGLIYQNESGALNEAWSDIFAAAAEFFVAGAIDDNTWKLGELVFTPGTAGDALRYMNDPTRDGISRDNYPERYTGGDDAGGVHINSGIANLAFLLLVQGGGHPRGLSAQRVLPLGMARTEAIFDRAQTSYWTPGSHFAAARQATAAAARDLYGEVAETAVHQAWCAVLVPGCPAGIPQPQATVNAASFRSEALAAESIASAFGTNLALTTESATSLPLPTKLGGAEVRVTDASGVERRAGLFYASAAQVNYEIPAGTAAGPARVRVVTDSGVGAIGPIDVAAVGPGLFSKEATGRGPAAGYLTRVLPDNTQVIEQIVRFDDATGRWVLLPIDLGPENHRVFLILFGTGFRFRSDLGAVTARVGGETVPVAFASRQGDFVGLDQANIELPRSLAGRGTTEVSLTVDGRTTNAVSITVR